VPTITDADIKAISGAFWAPDRDMFRVLLKATQPMGGDLAELGVFYGASAVLVGSYLQPGETFTVIDLFETPASDDANVEENADQYAGLTQQAFEDNYRRLVGEPPVVIQDFSENIVHHAAHGTHRFVHVDASHLYEHVVKDIDVAKILLKPDGVLVMDDIRAPHTPGVAAAAWQAVTRTGMRPFAISPQKLYATWGDPAPWREALLTWVRAEGLGHEIQRVNDLDLLRIMEDPRDVHPLQKFIPEAAWPAAVKVSKVVRDLRR
jgi:predicted O-methyltransferase YrrM